MNTSRLLLLSAALSAALVAPAHAELRSVGTVYLDRTAPTHQYREAFPAPVERIAFKAVNGAVSCDSIRATLSDGTTQELLKGGVSPGATEVTAPGGIIQRIDFQCQSTSTMPGVQVMVELGRHEAAWRAHADWNSRWWYRIAPGEAYTAPAQNRS